MAVALQTWLEDPSGVRGVFVIANAFNGSVDQEIYLSSVGYITTDGITSFEPIIKQGIRFTEKLDIDGRANLSYGDIEINNFNGELDSWLSSSTYVWVNRSVKIYIGDPQWATASIAAFKTEFHLIFDGIIADIDSKDRETLNIKLRDKLERLNTPITEAKLGAYGTWGGSNTSNEDVILPLVFGECHNITPLLIDPSQLEYMANNDSTERIIEIRDNGVPIYTDTGLAGAITSTANIVLATGKFKMNQQTAGTITVSVQGVKKSVTLTTGAATATYTNNIANLIAVIVTEFGKTGYKLNATTEIDLPNFNTFATNNTQAVGIYVSGRENVINVCQALAGSVGAQVFMNRTGKLQLLRAGTFSGDTPVTITDADILHHSLSISSRTEVLATAKVGYCKNWTVQSDLLTGIPQDHKDLFAKEWLESSAVVDSAIKTKYRLDEEPEQVDTMLLTTAAADAEALRLRDFFKTPKTVYRFIGKANLLSLKLGQEVTLKHNRFDLYNNDNGRQGQVVSLSPNWLDATIEIEVLI